MQIKTVRELQATINGHFHHVEGPLVLFFASNKFGSVEERQIEYKPIIGYSDMHDYSGISTERDLFFYWREPGKDYQRQCSLLDRNIPENGYNDWRIFTNREEAENYVNPPMWEEGAVYRVKDKAERERHWGLGGYLKTVYVDHELKQALVKNHKGLHLLGIHMLPLMERVNTKINS